MEILCGPEIVQDDQVPVFGRYDRTHASAVSITCMCYCGRHGAAGNLPDGWISAPPIRARLTFLLQ